MLHHRLPADGQPLGQLGGSQRAPLADEREHGTPGRVAERLEDVIGGRAHTRANWRVRQWRSRSNMRSSHIAPSDIRKLAPATDARVSVTATCVPCSTACQLEHHAARDSVVRGPTTRTRAARLRGPAR